MAPIDPDIYDQEGFGPLADDRFPDEKIIPLFALEREAIRHALQILRGNKTRAAQALGISVRSLRDRVRRFKLLEFIIESPSRGIKPGAVKE